MHTEAFDLVGADRRGRLVAGDVEIAVDGLVAERSHPQMRNRHGLPRDGLVVDNSKSGMQFVPLCRQSLELVEGFGPVCRLCKNHVAERQRLVGAENPAAGKIPRDVLSLRRGQP